MRMTSQEILDVEEEIVDSLDLIVESARMVQERFAGVGAPEDFVRTPEGVTLLDAITMRLQVIGESVKLLESDQNVWRYK